MMNEKAVTMFYNVTIYLAIYLNLSTKDHCRNPFVELLLKVNYTFAVITHYTYLYCTSTYSNGCS